MLHSAGWPLDNSTYGGGWMYHFGENLVSVGLVVGLGYTNPYLSPFDEFQRYKSHPAIRSYLEGGKRLEYGSRRSTPAITVVPTCLTGAPVGCDAVLNAPRIKASCCVKSECWRSSCVEALAAVASVRLAPTRKRRRDVARSLSRA